jgi:hypothetical protein
VRIKLTDFSGILKTAATGIFLWLDNLTLLGPDVYQLGWAGTNSVTFGARDGPASYPKMEVSYVMTSEDVVGSYVDAASVATYGTIQRTIIERSIETTEEADLRAEYEAAVNAHPSTSLSMQWRQDGINLGESVPVELAAAGVSGSYVARKISMKWVSYDETIYSAELGRLRPDLVRLIRRLGNFRQAQAI